MNMLADGMTWLDQQLQDYCSETVTYTRGSDTVSILATIGRHVPKSLGAMVGDQVDTFETRFTLAAADLVLAAVRTVPDRGDTITLVKNGVTFVFEVLPIDGERWWRESDGFGLRLEINAKLKSRST